MTLNLHLGPVLALPLSPSAFSQQQLREELLDFYTAVAYQKLVRLVLEVHQLGEVPCLTMYGESHC